MVTRGGRGVLRASDFRLVGTYEVNYAYQDSVWGMGFTHRYVNGQIRFLTLDTRRQLVELALPANFGGYVTETGRWPNIYEGATWSAGGGSHIGLWWDEAGKRLWSTDAVDYPNDTIAMETANIATRTLNAGGTISNLKRVTLQGIGSRRVYGGCQAVPASWRSQWGLLAYMCGWGGYSSRMAAGLGVSLGPTAYGLPDPATVANGTTFNTSQFKTYMEYPLVSSWYGQGRPTVGDRGVRNADVQNYYDGGDPRQNPSSEPTSPPLASAQWLSPAPDGLGRMVWGDSFYNTGMAIDGAQLYGFALVGCFSGGKAWYGSSTLHNDRRVFELQVFDPAHFAEAAAGTRKSWEVKPVSREVIQLAGLGNGSPMNVQAGCPLGATYDPLTKRAYVYGTWVLPEIRNRIYVFDVAGQ